MDFRLYFMDRNDHIEDVAEIACNDHKAAIQLAAAKADGRAMELWQLHTRIKVFAAEIPSKPAHHTDFYDAGRDGPVASVK